MHCPRCGVEVVEQAGFCHKCGVRLDLDDRQLPSNGPREGQTVSEEMSAEPFPDEAAAQPAPGPTDKLKETLTAPKKAEEEPEKELWQGSYSWKAMIRSWILSVLITVGVLAIWIKWVSSSYWIIMLVLMALPWVYSFLALKYRQWNIRYHLTTQRFIHETGILRRVTDRIEVIDMDDITFEQSFLERFVGVGTILITSSDRTHPELTMPGIENVKAVAEMLDETRRSERRRRGLHIESI